MYREIVFRLSVDKHPELANQLNGFAQMVRQTYAEINKSAAVLQASAASGTAGGTAPGVGTSTSRTTQERVKAEREAGAAVAKEASTIAEARARVEEIRQRQELSKLNKFLKEREELTNRFADASRQLEELAQGETNPEVAKVYWDTLDQARAVYYEKDAELAEKAAAEQEKVADKAAVRRLKLLEQEAKAQERLAKEADAAAKQEARELEALDAKYQTMQGRIRSAKREITSTFAELGGSIMRTARGVTALGLAGEEDLQKVVKGLLKIQGAFDIISGGLQVWVKMQQLIEGVRKMLVATALAEEALAAATAKRAAAQALAGGAGAAGGVGGAVSSTVKDIGEMTAGTLLARGLRQFGGKIVGAAGGLAAGATVGVAGGLAADYFSGDGYSKGGFGERVGGGFLDPRTLGRWDKWRGVERGSGSGIFSGSTFRDLVGSDEDLEKQEKNSKVREEQYKAQAEAVAKELPKIVQGYADRRSARAGNLSADMSTIDRENDRFGAGVKSQEIQKRLSQEILATEKEIADVKATIAATAGRFTDKIKADTEEQLALEKTRRDLVIERATVARDAAAEELRSSERQLQNVDATLERQQQVLMTLQDQMRSAQERFGLMDTEQQQTVLDAFRRGKAGGDLTTDELRSLKGLGSDEADNIVRQQAEARAKAAGADVLFNAERQKIANLESDIAKNVEVRTDIEWEVTFDKKVLDEQAAKLEKAIKDGLVEQETKTSEAVKKAMAGIVGNINTRIDGLEQRVASGAGGRN